MGSVTEEWAVYIRGTAVRAVKAAETENLPPCVTERRTGADTAPGCLSLIVCCLFGISDAAGGALYSFDTPELEVEPFAVQVTVGRQFAGFYA